MNGTLAEELVTTSADKNADLQWVQIGLIVPSITNPRHTRSAEKDAELYLSVKDRGVKQAGLLRPVTATAEHVRRLEKFNSPTMGVSGLTAAFGPGDAVFEIVAGQRRWEASMKAGKKQYPAMVQRMSDEEAFELQIIENDDREDLDDMDRALAYRALFDKWKKDPGVSAKAKLEQMADRIKRKPRTVYQIMALADLCREAQALLRSGEIQPSHAYELCRRTVEVQQQLVKWMKQHWGGIPSVRELKEHVKREYDLSLDAAPWKKDDTSLLRAAGACNVCEKNTAVNPHLAPDQKAKGSGTCIDPACYRQKLDNYLVQIENAQKTAGDKVVRIATEYDTKGTKSNPVVLHQDWKEVKEGSCAHVVTGVVVDGKNPGQKKLVCTKKNCTAHWAAWERGGNGYAISAGARPRSEADKKQMLQKQRNKKLDQQYRAAATAAIRTKVTELKHADLQEVAIVLFDRLDRRLQDPVKAAMGWRTDGWNTPVKQITSLKPAELAGFIALVSIADNILPAGDYWGSKSPVKADGFNKRHKVNLEKVHAETAAPLRAKWKEIDARKAKAAAAAKAQTSAKGKKKAA